MFGFEDLPHTSFTDEVGNPIGTEVQLLFALSEVVPPDMQSMIPAQRESLQAICQQLGSPEEGPVGFGDVLATRIA